MESFSVIHAGVYRFAQTADWKNSWPFLGFYIRGLRWRRSGDILETRFVPSLTLRPAHELQQFCYGPDRENWVVALRTEAIRPGPSPDTVALLWGGHPVTLPRMTPIRAAEIPDMRDLFARIVEVSRDPSARGQLYAHALVLTALGHILERHANARRVLSPAERFKSLLDADDAWERSLAQHSRACGFSVDHMRELFEAEYGMNPHRYRSERRLQRALQLLEHTPLRIKEIAAQLGFRHVSHFCMAYRKAFGNNPSAARGE